MSAPAIDNTPKPPFWSEPSTRWDVLKTAIPLAILVGGFLFSLKTDQQATAHDVVEIKRDVVNVQATNAGFQQTKEQRIQQMAVIETVQKQQGADIAEIKASQLRQEETLKDILQRLPRK